MRQNRIITAIFVAALAAGLASSPAWATGKAAQRIEKTAKICRAETLKVERDLGIPNQLLGAISLAETGRWDNRREESFAWPWTVMAEGRGRYFDSKADAVAEVEQLLDRGITNIDVGCMQINLYYHGGAFADLNEAMDPATNAAYAGEYLKNLHSAAGSWTTAAGYYHSTTPERSAAYRERVVALWDRPGESLTTATAGQRRGIKPSRMINPTILARHAVVSIDMARTAELNARLRIARAAERQTDFETQRQQDLAYWRKARTAGQPIHHIAKMRRARAAATRQREVDSMGVDRSQSFEQRRKDQLRRWRLSARKPNSPS